MLLDVDANILGVVVNAVDTTSAFGGKSYGSKYGYGYGYGYRYASEQYREHSENDQRKQLTLQS